MASFGNGPRPLQGSPGRDGMVQGVLGGSEAACQGGIAVGVPACSAAPGVPQDVEAAPAQPAPGVTNTLQVLLDGAGGVAARSGIMPLKR